MHSGAFEICCFRHSPIIVLLLPFSSDNSNVDISEEQLMIHDDKQGFCEFIEQGAVKCC